MVCQSCRKNFAGGIFSFVRQDSYVVTSDKGKQVGLSKVELYQRRMDRAEAKNVAAQHPQEVERMMTEIGKWLDAEKQIKSFLGSGAKATMDQKTLEQLRSLGYVGGKQ